MKHMDVINTSITPRWRLEPARAWTRRSELSGRDSRERGSLARPKQGLRLVLRSLVPHQPTDRSISPVGGVASASGLKLHLQADLSEPYVMSEPIRDREESRTLGVCPISDRVRGGNDPYSPDEEHVCYIFIYTCV